MNQTPEDNPVPDIDAAAAADLVALADGLLDPAREQEVLKRAGGSRELEALLEEQRRALALIARAGEEDAPEALHARVQELAQERAGHGLWRLRGRSSSDSAGRAQRGRATSRRSGRLALAGGLAVALVAAVAVALSLGSGGTSGATLHEFAALGARPATLGAPAKRPQRPQLMVSVDGVAFPYWEDQFGWRASGVRTDTVAGHPVKTVFYHNASGATIAYSIVAGAAPHVGGSPLGSAAWRGGVRYSLLNVGGAPAIVWQRSGHLCVLTGHGTNAHALLALASWTGSGRLA